MFVSDGFLHGGVSLSEGMKDETGVCTFHYLVAVMNVAHRKRLH